MPVYNDNPLSALVSHHNRGNLILKFCIDMPCSFSDATRERLVEILA
jgi:hypothetical protein